MAAFFKITGGIPSPPITLEVSSSAKMLIEHKEFLGKNDVLSEGESELLLKME